MVAEARDEDRDTRQGCGTASVPPLKSNRNVEKATWFSGSSVRPFPGACLLVSWLCGRPWPLAFFSGSVCGSGPVVCSWPCCVVWFRPPGLFQKEATNRRPRAPTPKTGFYLTDRPRAERALRGGLRFLLCLSRLFFCFRCAAVPTCDLFCGPKAAFRTRSLLFALSLSCVHVSKYSCSRQCIHFHQFPEAESSIESTTKLFPHSFRGNAF